MHLAVVAYEFPQVLLPWALYKEAVPADPERRRGRPSWRVTRPADSYTTLNVNLSKKARSLGILDYTEKKGNP